MSIILWKCQRKYQYYYYSIEKKWNVSIISDEGLSLKNNDAFQ